MFFLAILAMVLTGLSWVLTGALIGGGERRNLPSSVLTMVYATMIAIAAGIWYLATPHVALTPRQWLFGAGSLFLGGLFNYIQLVCLGRALKFGPNGVVWTIFQSGMLIPFLVGVIFFGEKMSAWNFIGIAFILATLLLYGSSIDGKTAAAAKANGHWTNDWRIMSALGFVLTGLLQAFIGLPNYFSEYNECLTPVLKVVVAYGGIAAGFFIFNGRLVTKPVFTKHLKNRYLWIYSSSLAITGLLVGFFLQHPGLNYLTNVANKGAICFPICVCSCILGFALFSILALREKNNWQQIVALVTALLGIMLVSC